MTTIETANLALLKIGVSQGIAALDEQSREAYTTGQVYDTELRATLRSYPWSFATRYADLLLARGPFWDDDPTELTLVQAWSSTLTYAVGDVVRLSSVNYYCIQANTNKSPDTETAYWSTDEDDAPDFANGDWLYGYRQPDDCLFQRRLVPPGGFGRTFNRSPITFRKGSDVNGLLIYTNAREAVLEYTGLNCDALYADDLFIDAFTWRLASKLAPSLSQNGKTATDCLQAFLLTLQIANARDMQEQQQEKDGDATWIDGR